MLDRTSRDRQVELTDPSYFPGTIRHIVLFRYRENITVDEMTTVRKRFHELSSSERDGRRYILSIESGTQNSPEGLGQGFDHAFIVSFASQGDRNYYVGEPLITDPALFDADHHAFKAFVGSHLAGSGSALVFDFSTSNPAR